MAKRRYLDEPDNPPKRESEKLIEKAKDTKYDPTIAFSEKSLIKSNIKDYNENTVNYVGDYFNSYANSEGVNRIKNNQLKWYSSYHPIRDRWYGRLFYGNPIEGANSVIKNLRVLDTNGIYEVDAPVSNSKSVEIGNKKAIIIGNEKDGEYDSPEGFVLPHELIHRLPDSKLRGAQADALDRNKNTIINGHDELNEEKYSDLQGLRFLLYDEGIYDSRGLKDATSEDIQKLREKYPNLRPLEQMDNEKAAWMINHIVQNDNNDLYRRSLKHGGIYIKPSHRGRFTALKERTGHSATWFKENGTPAQKKMATFALNAAKWKH